MRVPSMRWRKGKGGFQSQPLGNPYLPNGKKRLSTPFHSPQHTSIALPADLAAQAAFFARLHRDKTVAAWLQRVVKERLDWEEAAFMRLKRQLGAKRSA